MSYLTFSDCLIALFKRKRGLVTFRSHVLSGDFDDSAILSHLPKVQEKLRSFVLRDVFNADEFWFNYLMAPYTTVSYNPMQGPRITSSAYEFWRSPTPIGRRSMFC